MKFRKLSHLCTIADLLLLDNLFCITNPLNVITNLILYIWPATNRALGTQGELHLRKRQNAGDSVSYKSNAICISFWAKEKTSHVCMQCLICACQNAMYAFIRDAEDSVFVGNINLSLIHLIHIPAVTAMFLQALPVTVFCSICESFLPVFSFPHLQIHLHSLPP